MVAVWGAYGSGFGVGLETGKSQRSLRSMWGHQSSSDKAFPYCVYLPVWQACYSVQPGCQVDSHAAR
jgi:hypothetical protein